MGTRAVSAPLWCPLSKQGVLSLSMLQGMFEGRSEGPQGFVAAGVAHSLQRNMTTKLCNKHYSRQNVVRKSDLAICPRLWRCSMAIAHGARSVLGYAPPLMPSLTDSQTSGTKSAAQPERPTPRSLVCAGATQTATGCWGARVAARKSHGSARRSERSLRRPGAAAALRAAAVVSRHGASNPWPGLFSCVQGAPRTDGGWCRVPRLHAALPHQEGP